MNAVEPEPDRVDVTLSLPREVLEAVDRGVRDANLDLDERRRAALEAVLVDLLLQGGPRARPGLGERLRTWIAKRAAPQDPVRVDAEILNTSEETARRDVGSLAPYLRSCQGVAGHGEGESGRSDAHLVLSVLIGHVVARLRAGHGDADLLPAWFARAVRIR